jgi:hypothetical protein
VQLLLLAGGFVFQRGVVPRPQEEAPSVASQHAGGCSSDVHNVDELSSLFGLATL